MGPDNKKAKPRRLDQWLVENTEIPSRQKAQALVLAGCIFINQQKAKSVAQKITERDEVKVRGQDHPYVSRAGMKLAHALEKFQIDVAGKVALDVGASTGGFTDCLLQNNAAYVYAVDVGYGQIAWKLRQDERVNVIERTNVRHWEAAEIERKIDLIVMDVSFISITKLIPQLNKILENKGSLYPEMICLFKPQFEAGREKIGAGGVVRDPEVIAEVNQCLKEFLQSQHWEIIGMSASPVKGTKGNQESLCYARWKSAKISENAELSSVS